MALGTVTYFVIVCTTFGFYYDVVASGINVFCRMLSEFESFLFYPKWAGNSSTCDGNGVKHDGVASRMQDTCHNVNQGFHCNVKATRGESVAKVWKRRDKGAAKVRQRCGKGAAKARQKCGKGAAKVRQRCGKGAAKVRQKCGKGAAKVRQKCGKDAAKVRQILNFRGFKKV